MTTMTDGLGSGATPPEPPVPPAPSAQPRQLRRSNTDRVAAGVSGGLGEYFGVDPVLFRVLFAVTSFFGGAGVIAYLLAWILIPDHTTAQAPMDRISGWMRRSKIPFWLVATVVVIIAWATFFSWWAPGPAGGLVIAVVILAVVLSRRSKVPAGTTPSAPVGTGSPGSPGSPVISSATVPYAMAGATSTTADPIAPYLPETRAWIQESRERRRRSAPVRWATLGVLVAALGGIAIADAIGGVVFPVYFWVLGGVVIAGLIAGLVTRRTPWGLTVLLVPAVIGLIAFGGTKASLHDGMGRTVLTPTSVAQLDGTYRLAFGQLTLDLRSLPTLDTARTLDITVAGGQVQLLLPPTLNASVHANVHAGDVRIDSDRHDENGGFNLTHEVAAPATATGAPLTINVHLATGEVLVDHS